MKYFKEGQTVYCSIYGEGVVYKIDKDAWEYPIQVKFLGEREVVPYTLDGRFLVGKPICLSQKPIPPIINEPIIEFEDGELVWCNMGNLWYARYYCKFEDNNHYCYENQDKCGRAIKWNEVRKFEDNPLL